MSDDQRSQEIKRGFEGITAFLFGIVGSWMLGVVLVNLFHYQSYFFAICSAVGMILTASYISIRNESRDHGQQ